MRSCFVSFFFFNDTATTEIYTLSLHDALPISPRAIFVRRRARASTRPRTARGARRPLRRGRSDRKSTRLNSSHMSISYAVFCLKKKKNKDYTLLQARSAERPSYDELSDTKTCT